jgi:hypothetical protein
MSFDWNWFFSSFCQSAAALIGIIAAFVISRLIGLNERISAVISVFDSLKIEFSRIKESLANRRFKWYNYSNVRYDSDLKKAIKSGEYDGLDEDQILQKIYENDSRLFNENGGILEAFRELYKQDRHFAQLDMWPDGFWDRVSQESDRINQLTVEAKTLILQFTQNKSDLNSFKESTGQLKIVIVLLMIAFPLTVIYPLHFMPVSLNEEPVIIFSATNIIQSVFAFKGLMLALFFVTIEGIFYYFLILINRIKRGIDDAIRLHLEEYSKLSSYSPHLRE